MEYLFGCWHNIGAWVSQAQYLGKVAEASLTQNYYKIAIVDKTMPQWHSHRHTHDSMG